jgi:hypothetical protein
MGGAESNHGAMMRPGTHSTSHRTTHSSAHRGRRATGTVSSVRQLTATLTATLTGPGHSPVSRAARSERRGSLIGLSGRPGVGRGSPRDHRARNPERVFMRSSDESSLPRRLGVLAPQKVVQISSVRQLTATLTATLTGPGLPCELKGAVGATRLGIGLSAGTEEGVHAFRDHRAVFGVLWVKAHNGPRRRYGSQL